MALKLTEEHLKRISVLENWLKTQKWKPEGNISFRDISEDSQLNYAVINGGVAATSFTPENDTLWNFTYAETYENAIAIVKWNCGYIYIILDLVDGVVLNEIRKDQDFHAQHYYPYVSGSKFPPWLW